MKQLMSLLMILLMISVATAQSSAPYPTASQTETPKEMESPTPKETETPNESPTPKSSQKEKVELIIAQNTPEPTPVVSPTPQESPSPEATSEPTPEPTQEPTPTPQETPEPTPEATPEPTQEPTPTPQVTPEPTPQYSPTPVESPTPVYSPTPEETPRQSSCDPLACDANNDGRVNEDDVTYATRIFTGEDMTSCEIESMALCAPDYARADVSDIVAIQRRIASEPSLYSCPQAYGDYNNNGNFETEDAVILLSYLFEGGPGFETGCDTLDVNKDGNVDISDAITVLNYVNEGRTPEVPPSDNPTPNPSATPTTSPTPQYSPTPVYSPTPEYTPRIEMQYTIYEDANTYTLYVQPIVNGRKTQSAYVNAGVQQLSEINGQLAASAVSMASNNPTNRFPTTFEYTDYGFRINQYSTAKWNSYNYLVILVDYGEYNSEWYIPYEEVQITQAPTCSNLACDANNDGQIDISDLVVAPSIYTAVHELSECEVRNIAMCAEPASQADTTDLIRVYENIFGTPSSFTCPAMRGDINNNNVVDNEDGILILNYLFNGGAWFTNECDQGDYNQDANVDISDAIAIFRRDTVAEQPTQCSNLACDANNDGQLDISDLAVAPSIYTAVHELNDCQVRNIAMCAEPASRADTTDLIHIHDKIFGTPSSFICPAIRGDINSDNQVNTQDGILILNYLFNGGVWFTTACDQGDFNQDGNVDISDAIAIFNTNRPNTQKKNPQPTPAIIPPRERPQIEECEDCEVIQDPFADRRQRLNKIIAKMQAFANKMYLDNPNTMYFEISDDIELARINLREAESRGEIKEVARELRNVVGDLRVYYALQKEQ